MTDDDQVWSAFSRDPRDPGEATLRASDADRDVVHRMLAEAYADGRIDRLELDARTADTESARTLGDLLAPMQGLVSARPQHRREMTSPAELDRRAVEAWRKDRREALWGLISTSAIVWTIWLVISGVGSFPWPLFVSLAVALNLGKVQLQRASIVAQHRAKLEKRERKEIERRREAQEDEDGDGDGDEGD